MVAKWGFFKCLRGTRRISFWFTPETTSLEHFKLWIFLISPPTYTRVFWVCFLVCAGTFRWVHETKDIQLVKRSEGDEEQVPEHQDDSCQVKSCFEIKFSRKSFRLLRYADSYPVSYLTSTSSCGLQIRETRQSRGATKLNKPVLLKSH